MQSPGLQLQGFDHTSMSLQPLGARTDACGTQRMLSWSRVVAELHAGQQRAQAGMGLGAITHCSQRWCR